MPGGRKLTLRITAVLIALLGAAMAWQGLGLALLGGTMALRRRLNLPFLIGPSRKRFIGELTGDATGEVTGLLTLTGEATGEPMGDS